MLADKAPCAPLFFGSNDTLTVSGLSKVSYNYLGAPIFNKAVLKNYEKFKTSETGTTTKANNNAATDADTSADAQ